MGLKSFHASNRVRVSVEGIYWSPTFIWAAWFGLIVGYILNSQCNGHQIDHYDGVIMGAMASQITSLTIVYSTIYSDANQRKHQSFVSLAFMWGFHRGPVNSPHKWPVTRKMFPFDDVIMIVAFFSDFASHRYKRNCKFRWTKFARWLK